MMLEPDPKFFLRRGRDENDYDIFLSTLIDLADIKGFHGLEIIGKMGDFMSH